jgi:pimeloyl-ACP methyl ester carboxylesterase
MKNIISIALLLYIGVGLFLYLKQRSFIYFPVGDKSSTLSSRMLDNDGHSINIYVLNETAVNAIIYFGGNAENVAHNADSFSTKFSDYAVYLINYRGYGGSTGTPSESAIYSDALKVFDSIKLDHPSTVVMGRSLGSAVATYVAAQRAVHKLILVTPFDSVQRIAQSQFPIYPMSLLLKDKHDSFARAKHIQARTLVIAATQDRVIKMPRTQRLLTGFETDVEFHALEGVGHNDISSHPNYYRLIEQFLFTSADAK